MRAAGNQDIALIHAARDAAQNAYCPYSHFAVGAAVETDQGVFTGCNIENASYSLGVCAERVAIHSAISAGAKQIIRLAVSCRDADESDGSAGLMPCGACRQVMTEFMAANADVLVDGVGILSVDELIPLAFRLGTGKSKTPPGSEP